MYAYTVTRYTGRAPLAVFTSKRTALEWAERFTDTVPTGTTPHLIVECWQDGNVRDTVHVYGAH